LLSTCLDAAVERVASSVIASDPWPHLWIPDLLPEDQYQQLLDHPISDRYLQTLSKMGRTNPGSYPNRWVMALDSNMPILTEPERGVWQAVNDFMIRQLAPAVTDKLQDYISNKLPIRAECLYVRDQQGYFLGPHTDSTRKVLTMILYLAQPGNHDIPGTSLYQPKNLEFRCAGGPHYTHDQFDRVKTVPYRANSLFAFAKSDCSFHGVEPMIRPGLRDLLICNIHVAK